MPADDDPHEHHPREHREICAVLLAAGDGTRMGGGAASTMPKVLQPLAGRALAAHALHALAASGVGRAVAVIPPGERGERIRDGLRADAPPAMTLSFAVQEEATGTADAVLAAQPHFDGAEALVVNGDLGLLGEAQLRPLLDAPRAAALLTTARLDDPAEMGRILRERSGEPADGRVLDIVEYRDATAEQREINEVNVGLYRFDAAWLWGALTRVPERESGERYATDVIKEAARLRQLAAVEIALPDGRLNIETPQDLIAAERVARRRAVERLIAAGALFVDPSASWVDAAVEIGAGATIEPGCHLRGRTRIGPGSRIGPNVVLRDALVGADCALESCTVRGSTLGDRVEVGPYSTIREGCELGDGVRIGTHAELKNAQLGAGVKVGHFSYLGDAEVGAEVNIGAGAITCNYDGQTKHRTRIGAGAFIGSDSLLIPPLEIGARARTGAGAVVTKDVPADGNAVGHPARLVGGGQRKRRPSEQASEQGGDSR